MERRIRVRLASLSVLVTALASLGFACGGGGTAGLTFDIRQNVHLFTLGLNYRFGLGDSGPVVARY